MVFVPGTFLAEYRVARKFPVFSAEGWWVNRWPFLGWLETVLKVLAFCYAAYVPLPNASPRVHPPFAIDLAPYYCQTILMLGGSVLLTLGICDRLFLYREVFSMLFVFPNVWAHWKVFLALFHFGRAGISIVNFRMFCSLMLAGDIVKLVFFAVHDFSMLNIARYILYLLVLCFAILYAVVLLIDYGYLTGIAALVIKQVALIVPYIGKMTVD